LLALAGRTPLLAMKMMPPAAAAGTGLSRPVPLEPTSEPAPSLRAPLEPQNLPALEPAVSEPEPHPVSVQERDPVTVHKPLLDQPMSEPAPALLDLELLMKSALDPLKPLKPLKPLAAVMALTGLPTQAGPTPAARRPVVTRPSDAASAPKFGAEAL
jgi:hypothetical protein